MFLQGTRRGSHELKAMTVLFNAFGLSLTKRWKTSGFFGIPPPTEPLSKSSVLVGGLDEEGSRGVGSSALSRSSASTRRPRLRERGEVWGWQTTLCLGRCGWTPTRRSRPGSGSPPLTVEDHWGRPQDSYAD
jgi:hypothetical protein